MRAFTVSTVDIDRCPKRSLLPSHYRENGVCECVLTVRADEVLVGDRIVGRHGDAPYGLVFVVGRIRDHNRQGRRLGPRWYAVNSKEVGRLDAAADTLFYVLRP